MSEKSNTAGMSPADKPDKFLNEVIENFENLNTRFSKLRCTLTEANDRLGFNYPEPCEASGENKSIPNTFKDKILDCLNYYAMVVNQLEKEVTLLHDHI